MRASLAARVQTADVAGWVPMRIVLAVVDLVAEDEVLVVAECPAPQPPTFAVWKLTALRSEVRRAVPELAAGDILLLHSGGRHAVLNLPRSSAPIGTIQ